MVLISGYELHYQYTMKCFDFSKINCRPMSISDFQKNLTNLLNFLVFFVCKTAHKPSHIH